MQVHLMRPEEAGDFHEFVRTHPYGDVLQTAAWARLKAASGWKPHFLLGRSPEGEARAACLALERKLPRLPFALLYCPRGPVLDWEDPDAFASMAAELRALATRQRAILVKIDPPVPASHPAAARLIDAQGFVPVRDGGFGGVQPRCVMKLDLSPGLEAVFEGFKPKWRYNIRLAERKGVRIREGDGSDVDLFYDILLETARRDRFLVRGRSYFHDLWRELSKDGLIRIFLAEYEGTAIAGALLFVLGRQAWYTYGASSNEHRNVMPNHLLQWTMIREAAAAGCTVYDFRGVSCGGEDPASAHLQGLNRFKAGFNAQLVEYVGEFDLPVSKGLYVGWTKVAPAIAGLVRRKAAVQGGERPL